MPRARLVGFMVLFMVLVVLIFSRPDTISTRFYRSMRADECFLFSNVNVGYWGHSNQMLAAAKTIAVAKALGCKILPMYLSYLGTRQGEVKMEVLFETTADMVDLSQGSRDVHLLVDLALKAGNGTVRFEKGQLDRLALWLNPYKQEGSISIPCMVGKSTVNDVRLTMTNPFSCSQVVVFDEYAHEYPEMKGLFGLPLPFLMDASCQAEILGAKHLPPHINLQIAAKWVLWNLILGDMTFQQAEELVPTLTLPLLQDEMYSTFPFAKPNLITAHVRVDRLIGCSHSLSVALCGTNDSLAAETLNKVSQPAIYFLAGDRLANSSLLSQIEFHPQSKVVVAPDLYPLFKLLLSNLGMTNYSQFVSTYGDKAEEGFYDAINIVMDQILLGCGELLGTFYKTHRSTFSNRAGVLGQTIGYKVCLPRHALKPSYSPQLSSDEVDALYRTALRTGLNVDGTFQVGNQSWKTDPIINPVGCSLKGNFLKPLHFTHRWLNKDLPCHWCGQVKVP
jgi:hypothetical protein